MVIWYDLSVIEKLYDMTFFVYCLSENQVTYVQDKIDEKSSSLRNAFM